MSAETRSSVGRGSPRGDDLPEVADDRARRGAPGLHRLGPVDVLVHDGVGPRAELLAVAGRDADEVTDHGHRQQTAEQGHDVDGFARRAALDHRVDRLVRELTHARLERGDRP